MSYTVTSGNGDFKIDPTTINTANTSLQLPGKNYKDWGEPEANNFTHLLENFAGGTAPLNVRRGQLWYDTSTSPGKLTVFTANATNSGVVIGASADKLSTARNISLSGAATGSIAFDGSADVTIPVTLAPSGVTAGSYLSANITVDTFGRITSASAGLTGNDIHTPVNSFNTRIGDVTLTSADVVAALGYTPTNGGITTLNQGNISAGLGYTPANDAAVVHKAGDTMSGILNMGGQRITGLGAPSAASDAIRLQDYQSLVSGKTLRIFTGNPSITYNVTVSPNAPSGGSDGDVWYRY